MSQQFAPPPLTGGQLCAHCASVVQAPHVPPPELLPDPELLPVPLLDPLPELLPVPLLDPLPELLPVMPPELLPELLPDEEPDDDPELLPEELPPSELEPPSPPKSVRSGPVLPPPQAATRANAKPNSVSEPYFMGVGAFLPGDTPPVQN